MKVTDGRSYMVFENVEDGTAFEDEGILYIKLDREVRDVEDVSLYNAVVLESGALVFFRDDHVVKMLNAEVVVK